MNTEPNFDRDGIRLLTQEKAALRRRVLSAAPARSRVPAFRFSFAASAFAALLVLVSGSSLTYAAQKSGPGDLLHALELGVIEPVESSLSSAIASGGGEYRLDRLAERLEEFKDVQPGELDQNDVSDAIANVSSHADAALESARDRADSADRIEYLVQVSGLLEASEDILAALTTDVSIEPVGDEVAEEIADQVEEYARGKDQKELAGIVSSALDDTNELLDGVTPPLSSETQADFQDIAEEIADHDFGDALQIVTQVQVDVLTSQYLNAP